MDLGIQIILEVDIGALKLEREIKKKVEEERLRLRDKKERIILKKEKIILSVEKLEEDN